MKLKKSDIAVIVILLLSLVHILVVYPSMPQTIPTHWNIQGEIDGYGGKGTLFYIWGLNVLMAALFCVIPKIDPRGKNYARFDGFYQAFKIIMILFMTGINEMMIFSAFGKFNLSVEKIMPAAIGILFVIIGNYMPKCKQNYTFGIKTPWTLESEEVWNKTHRFSGPVWVVCGIAMAVSALFFDGMVNFIVTAIAIIVLVFSGVVYSYFCYKKTVKK